MIFPVRSPSTCFQLVYSAVSTSDSCLTPAIARMVQAWMGTSPEVQNGLFERNKGRLVARGNHQRPGIDYGKSFSPVMRLKSLRTILALKSLRTILALKSLRTILALAVIRDLDVIQFDIASAYLHGTLKEGVYMSNQRATSLPGRKIGCGALRRAHMG